MDNIKPGLSSEKKGYVTNDRISTYMGSGDVTVYSTPSMIALMEAAAVAAIGPQLPAGYSSVGTYLEVNHIAPSPLGQAIRARAEVTAVDDAAVTFRVEAWDEKEKIGEGTHRRMVIERERFMKRAEAKNAS
jgi:predicted thioesterase